MSAYPVRKEEYLPVKAPAKPPLGVAGDDSPAHLSPARARQMKVEAAFEAGEAYVRPFPGAVKLGIFLLAGAAMWGCVIAVVSLVAG